MLLQSAKSAHPSKYAYPVDGQHQQRSVLLSHATVTQQVVLKLKSSLLARKQQSDLFLA